MKEMSIPKIIHQTYKTHDLPEIYAMCQTEIKRFHPDFEYRFYTDEDMDKLMKDEFPDYYDKFNELPRMIMKIDMFRYFLMYKYGGLYADMDYRMFRPFDLLEKQIVLPCNREDSEGNPTCLGNCIFASVPGHPFWKTLIDSLFTIDRTKLDYSVDSLVDGHVDGTGPMFVFAMWKNFTKKDGMFTGQRNLFHPPSRNDPKYIEYLAASGCYGMHICTGVWRKNKL